MAVGVFAPNFGYMPAPNGATQITNASLSTVTNYGPPPNAVAFLLQAKDANANNVRWSLGVVATTSVGQQLQPGRDTGFIPCGVTLSVCSEGGTNEIELQWFISQ